MGVHLTFVRSVDLDEWTQRQIDAMRLGGNGNARSFFRKHGFTDLYGGRAEKKYTSKAAVAYRAELAKMVEAEAAKRGEGTAQAVESTGSLLDNLELVEKKEQDELAKVKLAEARANATGASVLQAKATQASSLAGASKLAVRPSAGGGSKVVLRKLSSGGLSASGMLKKKPSNVGSKLRVNKLAVAANGDADEAFEDVETTQKAVAEAEKEAVQLAADEALAKKLQAELNNGAPVRSMNGRNEIPDEPEPAEKQEIKPPEKKVSAMEENMARLKAMNSDFFAM
jgi:ADP-ribosylation factor GTPase-activating protein 2/3